MPHRRPQPEPEPDEPSFYTEGDRTFFDEDVLRGRAPAALPAWDPYAMGMSDPPSPVFAQPTPSPRKLSREAGASSSADTDGLGECVQLPRRFVGLADTYGCETLPPLPAASRCPFCMQTCARTGTHACAYVLRSALLTGPTECRAVRL